MSRILRTLVVAIAATALFGAIASAAFAVEAPYWKVGGARLAEKGTTEVLLKQEGNQVLKSTVATITCTEVKAKAGALLTGSAAGNPGGASGALEYSNCTWTAGGGEKCVITSKAGAKDKKIVTNALKVELGSSLKQEPLVKGNADRAWFSPAEGTTFVTVKSEAETGGKCTFAEAAVKGTVAVSVLNSKKEAVAVEEHELEEEFGFAKALANASAVCKVAAGKFTECASSSLNAFGVAATLEGTSRVELATKGKFGVFQGGGGGGGGGLEFENSEDPFKVPTGGNFEGDVKFNGVGKTGELTVSVSTGFEDNGSACDKANLGFLGKCGIRIKCNGAKGTKGIVTVHSPETFIHDITRNLLCT